MLEAQFFRSIVIFSAAGHSLSHPNDCSKGISEVYFWALVSFVKQEDLSIWPVTLIILIFTWKLKLLRSESGLQGWPHRGFESWLLCFLLVRPGASYFTSLGFRFCVTGGISVLWSRRGPARHTLQSEWQGRHSPGLAQVSQAALPPLGPRC